MVAVERIKEYSEVEQEAPEIVELRPPAHWPSLGEIHVEKLSIRYVSRKHSTFILVGFQVGVLKPFFFAFLTLIGT